MSAGHAYAAAISACAVGSVWPRAVKLFDEMMEVNIKPDVVSCTALISALGSDAQWERAERVIVWMHQVCISYQPSKSLVCSPPASSPPPSNITGCTVLKVMLDDAECSVCVCWREISASFMIPSASRPCPPPPYRG